MAAPNIVNVGNIYGKTTYLTPSGTSAVVLVTNASGSGKVLKINSLIATNVDGANTFNASVSVYSNGAVAQGSAPSGGTAYPIASTIDIPADASLIVVDKSTGLYLEENTCISVTSSTASKITYVVSYDEIS